MNDLLECPNPIGSVHGCFPIRWNSGRVVGIPKSAREIESLFMTYKELGINIYLTFSNHLIEKDDLDDTTCNFLLDILHQSGGSDNGKGMQNRPRISIHDDRSRRNHQLRAC